MRDFRFLQISHNFKASILFVMVDHIICDGMPHLVSITNRFGTPLINSLSEHH